MAHRYSEHVPRTGHKYRPSAPTARKSTTRGTHRPPPIPSTGAASHSLGVSNIGGLGLQGEDCSFLEVKDLFFTNLVLLGFNPLQQEEKSKIGFNRDMFDHPNRKGMEVILYFLFNKLNPQRTKVEFKTCWPIYDKKQEQQFRKTCAQWLGQIAKEDPSSRLPPIAASLLLTPGGTRFYQLMQLFSTHIVRTHMEKLAGSSEAIPHFPKELPKDRSTRELVSMATQAHIVCSQQRFVDILEEWMQTNQQLKEFASALTTEYRGLCRLERELERELSVLTEGLRDRAMESLQLEVPPGRDAEQTRATAHKTHRKLMEERAVKVEKQWKVVKEFLRRSDKQREVLDSVLSGKEKEHHLDAKDIALQIPEVMLREEHQLQQILGGKNTYVSGKLNVTALVRLWRHALLELRKGMKEGSQTGVGEEARAMRDCLSQQLSLHREGSQKAVALLTEVSELSTKLGQYIETRRKELENSDQNMGEFEVLGVQLSPPSTEAGSATSVRRTLPITPLHSAALSQAVSTPEAVRHIRQSFEEVSQKRALDQVTAGDPLAVLNQLLLPSQSSRSKIPTKGTAAKQAKSVGRKDAAMHPRAEPASTHTPSKATTQTTTRKKKAIVKRRDNAQASFASVEDTSVSVPRKARDSAAHGGATPSKVPLRPSVNYDFLNMSLEGDGHGVKTTAPPTRTEAGAQLPLTSPLHPHTPTTGGSSSLSETSDGASLPGQADGTTQDQQAAHKTPLLPKAYDILADEIVSAMVSGSDKGQKSSSTGHSSRYQTPELHGVADPVSALGTCAFTTRDKLARTPPATSQHQRPIEPATIGLSPLLSSPHYLPPGGAVRHPNADSPHASPLLITTESATPTGQQRSSETTTVLCQHTPSLSATRMAWQSPHDGSIHLEYCPSPSPSHMDSSPQLAAREEEVDDRLSSSVGGQLEGSNVPTPLQSLSGSGSVTPSTSTDSEGEQTPRPSTRPSTDHSQQLSQDGSRDSGNLLLTLVCVGGRDSLVKANSSGLYLDDDTPHMSRVQTEEGAVTPTKSDSNDKSDRGDNGEHSGGDTDEVEPVHTPEVTATGDDEMFLLATPPTPFREMSAFDDESPEDSDILSAARDSRKSSLENASDVSLQSVISSLHVGRDGDVSLNAYSGRPHFDTSLFPQPTSTRPSASVATPNCQSQSFDVSQSASVTPRVDPPSESLLLFTPAASTTHTAINRTHLLPGEESTMSSILLDGVPAPPEMTETSSLSYNFASLLSDTPQHSSNYRDLLTGTPLHRHSGGRTQGVPSTASFLLSTTTHTPSPLRDATHMNQTPSTAKGDRVSALQHVLQDRSVDSPLIKGL